MNLNNKVIRHDGTTHVCPRGLNPLNIADNATIIKQLKTKTFTVQDNELNCKELKEVSDMLILQPQSEEVYSTCNEYKASENLRL